MTSVEDAAKLFAERFCADELRDPEHGMVVAVGCNHEGIVVYVPSGKTWAYAVKRKWMDQFPKQFKGHPVNFKPRGRLKT